MEDLIYRENLEKQSILILTENLKESLSNSNNIAASNSIDLDNIKNYRLSNQFETKEEGEEPMNSEQPLMNEKFKSDVKNYLNSLYDTTTEKVETSYSGQQPKESDLIQDEKNKPSEGEEEKKYIEETVENNSKSYDRKKIVGFSSVECEINNTHLEKNEEVDGYKNKALTILCQFFKQSPIIFLNSGKACLENIKFKFFEKINEKQGNKKIEEQSNYNGSKDEVIKDKSMQIVLIMPLKTNHLNENLKTPLKTNKNFETISKQNNLKKYKILQTVNRAQLTAPKHISKSVSKSRPEDKTPKKQEPLKELKIIKTEKDKIYEKIKDIEKKLNQLPSLHPLKTPKTPKQQIKTLSSQTPNNGTDAYLIKIQEKKKETELKKQQKLEEKESGLKADIEKLNCEKQKILEVFKLEKQKLFWRKMHELEDRKADRLQNDIFYQEVVKIMIKNHKYPTKTPEFDKRKQQLAQKKKLLSEYSMKVKVESSNDNHIEKNNKKIIEKPKKKIRSLTPNQCKPNYLLEIKQKNKEYQEKSGVRLKKDCENWEKYLKDDKLNKNEKFNSVLNRAQIMENQAKMKEKVASFNTRGVLDIEMENEINELYVDSIKAKIALLKKLKD